MKLRLFFTINTIIALAFGIGFVLLPAALLTLFGMEESAGAMLFGQLFGVSLIAIGLVTWFARNITDAAAVRAIILALLISDAIGLVVSILGMLNGVMNTLGWTAVIIYLFLTLGYAYFLLKPEATLQHSGAV